MQSYFWSVITLRFGNIWLKWWKEAWGCGFLLFPLKAVCFDLGVSYLCLEMDCCLYCWYCVNTQLNAPDHQTAKTSASLQVNQNQSVWLSMSQYVWGSVQTAADYRFETSSVCVSSACSCNMTWVCVFAFSRYTSSWYTCCLLWREDSHCRYQWIKWILLILLDQVFFFITINVQHSGEKNRADQGRR